MPARSGAESNRCRGFCRPLPDHSATGQRCLPRALSSAVPSGSSAAAGAVAGGHLCAPPRRRSGVSKDGRGGGASAHGVEGQLRPNRVTDARLLAAFAGAAAAPVCSARTAGAGPCRCAKYVPLSPARGAACFSGAGAVGAGAGRAARRTGLRAGCRLRPSGAALLAALGAEVVKVEADPALPWRGRPAQVVLEAARPLWVVASPAGALDDPAASGPFDVMLVDSGAVPAVPEAAATRLVEGGRIALLLRRGRGRRSVRWGARRGGGVPPAAVRRHGTAAAGVYPRTSFAF